MGGGWWLISEWVYELSNGSVSLRLIGWVGVWVDATVGGIILSINNGNNDDDDNSSNNNAQFAQLVSGSFEEKEGLICRLVAAINLLSVVG